jgi:hypothetical protein
MTTFSTIKKLAASTVIAGSLGLGALSLGTAVAAADTGSGRSSDSTSAGDTSNKGFGSVKIPTIITPSLLAAAEKEQALKAKQRALEAERNRVQASVDAEQARAQQQRVLKVAETVGEGVAVVGGVVVVGVTGGAAAPAVVGIAIAANDAADVAG